MAASARSCDTLQDWFRFRGALQHLITLLAGQRPAAIWQFSNHRPLETVMEVECLPVVAAMVDKDGQRQLGRTTAAIAPLELGRTVIPQVEPGIEPAAIHRDDDGITFASSLILLLSRVSVRLHHFNFLAVPPRFHGLLLVVRILNWKRGRHVS